MTEYSSGIEALLDDLHGQFGEALRSCVEYLPTSNTIHYLRDDLDQTVADGRLIRIEELYHAERLTATPIIEDPELGTLDASIHLFEGVFVIHLIDPPGRVVGFSIDTEALSELHALVTKWHTTTFEPEQSTPD